MKLKIGYFADGPWAHRAFEKIIGDDSIEVCFMCVRYDKNDAILMEYASKYKIPLLIHSNINEIEFIDILKEFHTDLFVSMSFNQIFKDTIMQIPRFGIINCHAGKLPFYRGRNILNWVLINDEKEFGITVHYVDYGIDTGDIILQRTFNITDIDTYATLLERAYNECAEILYDAIKLIQNDEVKAIKQTTIDPVGFYCGMRQGGDEIIDWNQSSREIFNFIRALTEPGPKATAYLKGKEMKIICARMVAGAHVYKNTIGQVVGKTNNTFFVKTSDTILEITEYEYDGSVVIGDRFDKN
ncbi:MAG: methionyl-tRNA formyltransferase [Lachnospiraceae bacterium]|nr:methionyl-tRNA formyltransferase [Lachnospiraceae bacterium]